MTSEKLPYGHLMPERSARRERTGGPLGSLVGVLGTAAVFVSAVVLALIVQNISAKVERDHDEMAKLQAQAQRDHEEMAKLQEKVAILTTKAEKSDAEIIKLQARAEKDQEENQSLRERIVVLETQIRGASFPPNYMYAEQQQQRMSDSPEGGQSGRVDETNTGEQNNNATVGGLAHRRTKRDSPNWVRLPSGSGCCQSQPGRDGRDGRDGTAGPTGLKGEPGQKGETGMQGQGAKGQKGEQGTSGSNGLGGAVYTRWGRTTCPSGATTVYSGVAGGSHYNQPGGGTNYQCLPNDPEWGRYYQDGVQGFAAYMYGTEYQVNYNAPFGSRSLHNQNVPCAVCYVPTRGSKLMIPARNTCYSGWTREYHGYLMAGDNNHPGSKEYVCVDGQPEAVPGGQATDDEALFYPVEARCGSLPCPRYVEGRELTCVVCTKT